MSALPEAYLKLVLPLIDKARGFLEYGESLQPFAFVGMAGAAIQAEAETTGDEPGLQATLSGGHPIRPYYGLLGDELPVGRFDAPLAVRARLDPGSRKRATSSSHTLAASGMRKPNLTPSSSC